jgi:hypothetical protein
MNKMIQELDRVVLTRPVPEHGLEAGDVGTVVGIHDSGRGFTVEFMSLDGKTVAIVTERAEAFRPIRPREITHARQVA